MGRAFEYRRAAKEKRWGKMSKLFPKLAKAITVAARDGGSNPEVNARLRTAIQNAKTENMPKDNIENAIKRAEGKNVNDITEVVYEGKGPHGVLVYVECATDNIARTVAKLKSCFKKAGGGLVPSGSLEYLFSRKAVFEFEKKQNVDLEEVELSLIDEGLEEIEEYEGMVYVYANCTQFGAMYKALDDLNIEVKKANLKRIPAHPVVFTDEQLKDIEKMLERIEEEEDFQALYTNVA